MAHHLPHHEHRVLSILRALGNQQKEYRYSRRRRYPNWSTRRPEHSKAMKHRGRACNAEFANPSVPAGSAHAQGVDTCAVFRLRICSSHKIYSPNQPFQTHALYVEQGEIFAVESCQICVPPAGLHPKNIGKCCIFMVMKIQ